MFRDYLIHGWKLTSIVPGSKGPREKGWNTRERAISDPGTGPQIAGAGLCHAWSGTCAVDVDHYPTAREWLAERGVNLDALTVDPRAVMISSGRPDRAKLIYALPAPLASAKLAAYTKPGKTGKPQTFHALEFRCATADGLTVQDVLPPTIHPDTAQPYAWRYGDDLTGHWANLPPLPDGLRTLWLAELAPRSEAASSPAAPAVSIPLGAELQELRELLESQDPDASYDDWLRVGMALHHETSGSRDGFALWDTWSRGGAKYKGIDDLMPHWASFKSDAQNAVTLGSLRSAAIAKLEDFSIATDSAAPPTMPEFGGKSNPNFGEDTRPGAAIRKLLESRLVFVTGQDRYFDLGSKSEAWLSDRGVRHLFCPHMPTIVSPGKDGKADKVSRPDPVQHLQNSETKIIVDAVGIHPGALRLYNEDGRRYVNRFTPRVVEPLQPQPHESEAFNFLWGRMKEPVFQRWLMKFYAHALQKPGVKIQTAPLLFSEATGTGKNTIAKLVPELLFGTQWVRTMSGNVLAGNFNDVLGETWWLYLEELRSGGTKADRVQIANKIKAWVTDSFVEVHPKGLKPYDIRNRVQLIATSNFDDAVHIDNNDRRWAICELGAPLTEREALDLYAFLNSERAPGVLNYIFRRVDLTGFQPTGRAPLTEAKTVMVRSGLGTWESTIVERMAEQLGPFNRDLFALTDLQEQLGNDRVSVHVLAKLVQRHPFRCELMPSFQKKRLWGWRNIEPWRRATERERLRYMETGQYPDWGEWDTSVPEAVMQMSAEADALENSSCRHLL